MLCRQHRIPCIHNDLLVDSTFNVTVFEPLPRSDSCLVHVDVEQSHAPMKAAVACVAAKASTSSVTHPQGGLLVLVDGESTVVVDVITTMAI